MGHAGTSDLACVSVKHAKDLGCGEDWLVMMSCACAACQPGLAEGDVVHAGHSSEDRYRGRQESCRPAAAQVLEMFISFNISPALTGDPLHTLTAPRCRLLHDDQKESGLLPVLACLAKHFVYKFQSKEHARDLVQALHLVLRMLERWSKQGDCTSHRLPVHRALVL